MFFGHLFYFITQTIGKMHQPIATLNLSPSAVSRLHKNGVFTVNDYNSSANRVKHEHFSVLCKVPTTKTALELYHEELHWNPVKIAIPEINKILDEAIAPGLILEISGLTKSGKTQLCYHIALSVKCFFITNHLNFATRRLKDIISKIDSYKGQEEFLMNRIYVWNILGAQELKTAIFSLKKWLPLYPNAKCIIIDSITWPIKQILEKNERNNFMRKIVLELKRLANLHQVAVILTNDRTYSANEEEVLALGCTFSHFTNNKILLAKERDGFSAHILKSVSHTVFSDKKIKFNMV